MHTSNVVVCHCMTTAASSDYIPVQERIVFQPNETEHNITLQIISDDILEEDEEFLVVLSAPSEEEPISLLETNYKAVINILNDDGE